MTTRSRKSCEENFPAPYGPDRMGSAERNMPSRTYYDILGVPMGASIDHIKESYRLLPRKAPVTDAAYRTLTTVEQRLEFDAWRGGQSTPERTEEEQNFGSRGPERCECGEVLKPDGDSYCEKCCGSHDYFVVFDMFGGYIIHDKMPLVTGSDGHEYWHAPYGSLFGPFTREEAQTVLEEKNKMRKTAYGEEI
jgi:hypothetical protein